MNPAPSRVPLGAIATAAIACLQPGIDPIFLTLLSDASGVAPQAHGWIVAATQGGMAAGALLVWRYRPSLPGRTPRIAALCALPCSIATAMIHDIAALLLLRALFGLAMGIIYTDAMSAAAERRPATSYAAVFLTQLLLSTLAALLLPLVAQATTPGAALLALAAAPAALAILSAGPRQFVPSDTDRSMPPATNSAVSPAAWTLAFATFAFICATMMIWSSVGALAMSSGLGEGAIGLAVALGSIAGAATAMTVMRERRLVPLPLTGLLASAGLLSPLILTPTGNASLFVAAILLLNVGSTAIIIRCSGAATGANDDALFRRFVACTHPLGMIAGPVLSAILTATTDGRGLEPGAFIVLVTGCGALLLAARRPRRRAMTASETTLAT